MTPAEIDELKSRPGNSCGEVARRLGCHLRPYGRELIGPCPLCCSDLADRTATCWQTKDTGWVCAKCSMGGDVIWLVQKAVSLDFLGACRWLGWQDSPGRDTAVTQEDLDRQDRERQAAADAADAERRKKDEAQARYRERERRDLNALWTRAQDPAGTVVEAYLAGRGIPLPSWGAGAAQLRYLAEMPYVDGMVEDEAGRRSANVLHRGPAMLAAVTRTGGGDDGAFHGLHITYLDAGGQKLRLSDADGKELPPKKIRGSKAGGGVVIRLITCPPGEVVRRILIGEGIETVLSVWAAMVACEIDLAGVEFWSSLDLGNLGGKASATITHPTLKGASNRARRFPGPDPDLTAPGIVLPESVSEVTLLGDGDSDPVTTACALHRAQVRFTAAREDRVVAVAMALEGCDFNDMLLGKATAA